MTAAQRINISTHNVSTYQRTIDNDVISICIPIYNRDMCDTVRCLAEQAAHTGVECEIVCIDDYSDQSFRDANKPLRDMCRYIELEQNIGRARIRNLFLRYARYDYLLFLDCDSLPPEGFLSRYAEVIRQKPRVVCGGRVYAAGSDDREHHLRYAYGTRCESHTAAERSQHPYKSFMTNNFIVHREVLETIPFDERIARYGHEDTLFGYCLMQRHVPIVHIENPVINGDVETNSEFLRKTREGVRSLADIYEWKKDDREFLKQVSLLNFYSKVQKLGMAAIIGWVYRLSQPLLEKGFINGKHVSMRAFAFYKLGLFIQLLGNKPIYK